MINLKAIKKRLAKATPGPWGVAECRQDDNGVTWVHWIAPMFDDGEGGLKPGSPEDYIAETLDNYKNDSNAQFIAHARIDIEDLVAEVERLRKQMGKSWNCHECGGNHPWPAGRCPSPDIDWDAVAEAERFGALAVSSKHKRKKNAKETAD